MTSFMEFMTEALNDKILICRCLHCELKAFQCRKLHQQQPRADSAQTDTWTNLGRLSNAFLSSAAIKLFNAQGKMLGGKFRSKIPPLNVCGRAALNTTNCQRCIEVFHSIMSQCGISEAFTKHLRCSYVKRQTSAKWWCNQSDEQFSFSLKVGEITVR